MLGSVISPISLNDIYGIPSGAEAYKNAPCHGSNLYVHPLAVFIYRNRYNSGNTERRFDAKLTSTLKTTKIIPDLSETVKLLGYDIREVRDRVASSNAGSSTSKSPQNYTGIISDPQDGIDAQFKKKKTHEKRSKAREFAINHKREIVICDSTVRNFHKKLNKNPKEDTLDSSKLGVLEQKSEIDTELKSEEREIVMALDLVGRENRCPHYNALGSGFPPMQSC
ncbi:639_t:CDS:2 [Acaulospora morrowiae]|uniref:639_t:CDS:1 n=1 Tax=Acaulospora morrowiae TaxID=94023 RepID=A0A9N9F223_9GLOM|nr:639_t:CDS:2 [Acaulospora morrowiae]